MNYINSNKLKISKCFQINADYSGQRIDNYLIHKLKGVPKNKIYHLIRTGNIKVNNKSTFFFYKIKTNDYIYISPLFYNKNKIYLSKYFLNKKKHIIFKNILYEDKYLFIINKPNGIPVHGGEKVNFGIIELIREYYHKYIELVHRIDKDTSGILLLAKERITLKELHNQLVNKFINKEYLALVHGKLNISNYLVNLPLLKKKHKSYVQFNKGKRSLSYITYVKYFKNHTLLKIKLLTGRTHQIRVHLAYLGYPIVFDKKYGNLDLDKFFLQKTFINNDKYIFLHAYSFNFLHPNLKKKIKLFAPLNKNFINALQILNKYQ